MKRPNKLTDKDAEVTPEERAILDESFANGDSVDEQQIKKAGLDNTDADGEPLNERSMADDVSGEDLDVPGAEEDDEQEIIGEEDEENNAYSEADTE